MKKIVIGTRGSKLALWQANWVREQIQKHHPGMEVDLVKIKTKGDKILDVPLAQVGGKGLFVKEIEEAILDRRCDIAVHSLKDVPVEFPKGLFLAAYLEREDPRDVLVSKDKKTFRSLSAGAVVGTSSLRRKSQLLRHRADLNFVDLRGNLDTRIRKLATEKLDAIIVAAAGVVRLGLQENISENFSPDFILPAIGQGIVAIEAREDDADVLDIIRPLNHKETEIAARVERDFLHKLEGGCQVPIAGHASLDDERVRFSGFLGSLDGKTILEEKGDCSLNDSDCAALGVSMAEKIIERGGDKILAEVYGREVF